MVKGISLIIKTYLFLYIYLMKVRDLANLAMDTVKEWQEDQAARRQNEGDKPRPRDQLVYSLFLGE